MTGETEVRLGGEFRVAGRTLSGRAMVYGTMSPEHGEMFEPGSFAPVKPVPLLLQHDPSMVIVPAGEFELADSASALEVRAILPERSAVGKLLAKGALTGLSVKFHPLQESRIDGIRVIERARLAEISVVDEPSYPASTADIRARGSRGGRLGTLRGRIPRDRRVDCRCAGGGCTKGLFKSGTFNRAIDPDDADEILAVVDNYSGAIASKKRGGIRFWNGENGDLEFALDVPATEKGKALLDNMNAVPVTARPYLDDLASTSTIAGDTATYTSAEMRALIVKATDQSTGWDELVLGTLGEGPPTARREALEPRRGGLQWL